MLQNTCKTSEHTSDVHGSVGPPTLFNGLESCSTLTQDLKLKYHSLHYRGYVLFIYTLLVTLSIGETYTTVAGLLGVRGTL